jgi:NAD(P)-dependent dehydrogenase (short-subunit alcohol dehydrogenase family)
MGFQKEYNMISINENLKNKVAVITGGGGVLCSTIAKELIRHNMKIAIIDINEINGIQIENELNTISKSKNAAKFFYCDVLDKEATQKTAQEVVLHFGKIDVLINGTGGNSVEATTDEETFSSLNSDHKTFFDLTAEGFSFVFNLNFLSCFIATQAFSKYMLNKDCSIINISSMSAPSPMTKVPAYSAAKAGIENFTKWLSVYFSDNNLRVNAIAPGFFITTQNKNLLLNEDGSYTQRSTKVINKTPMKRFGDPTELCGAVLWLCDKNASSFVTGITIPIDGGFLAYSGV